MNITITKCEGKDCPIKEQCLRFTQEGKYFNHESYYKEIPYDNKKKECKFFWKAEKNN